MTHLWDRLAKAKKTLEPVQSKYRIVYEDPNDLEQPCKIVAPDPNWMAAALAGGVLPPIEAYIKDQQVVTNYVKKHGTLNGFNWKNYKPQHPHAEPVGPMTEEEAIEYLIMKDVPLHVWQDYKGNRQILKIVPVEAIPTNRDFRNAWRIEQKGDSECLQAL